MIKGYSHKPMGTVALAELINSGVITREEVFISSKAGLLYGDISAKLPPMKYLSEKLENKGISIEDFSEYEGLFQTLNPAFYEIALNKSLENLGLEMIDVYYIHIPEITKLKLTEDEFYEKMEMLIRWYETKCFEGKIRYYGIAFEFMVEEPFENKWHIEIERIKNIARKVSGEKNHFKYILFEYNIMCDWADTVNSQMIDGVKMTMIEACKALELETVASMPFAMGDGFKKYALSDMLDFVLKKMNHVIVGSKNPKHIEEILRCWRGNLSECSGRQRFSGTDLVEIAKCNNVSKRTIYRYKAYYEEMKEAESEKQNSLQKHVTEYQEAGENFMASSMIHLAIIRCIIVKTEFNNLDRLRLGVILPDGAVSGNSHLKKMICEQTRVTYDLEFYREKYGEQMKTDELYLGYYLHLIQDIFYRRYVYSEHHFNSSIPENVERLHQDYENTNWFVAKQYGLNQNMLRTQTLAGEPIMELADFREQELVREVREQFHPMEEKSSFFLTREMIREFIDRATEICLHELNQLAQGKAGLDSFEWSWMYYLTFGKYGTGGWASEDGTIQCIESAYDFESEKFTVSLLKHEAQHAKDLKEYPDITPAELEYRAKLVELYYSSDWELLGKFLKMADADKVNDSHAMASMRIKEEFSDGTYEDLEKIKERALELFKINTRELRHGSK